MATEIRRSAVRNLRSRFGHLNSAVSVAIEDVFSQLYVNQHRNSLLDYKWFSYV